MHRNKKKRNIIIFSLIGILLCMVVGYAAFQTRLEIKGTSKVTSNWDIEITNVTSGTPTGSAENAVAPDWDKLTASMEANLYDKGDAMEYDVTIENKGTIDAKLNDILTNLENSNSDAVIITFSGYTKGEILEAGGNKIIHVKIAYNPNYEGEETSSEVKIDFDYVQNDSGTNPPGNTYLVTYDCTTNGGNTCSSNNEYLTTGTPVNLSYNGSKDGWTFVGWNTDKNATSALSSLTMASDNVTLYAIYRKEAKTITITFNDNNVGSIGSTSQSCTIPAVYNNATQDTSCSITSPTITPTSGFSALGYNTSKDATSSEWGPNTAKDVSSNATYYAITRSTSQYTATFNANGATIGSESQSCYRYNGATNCTITAPSITRSGFTITGWGTNSSATTAEVNAGAQVELTANKTYYAITSKTVNVTYSRDSTVSAIGKTSDSCTIRNSATNCQITLPSITVDNSHFVDGWYSGNNKIGDPNETYNVTDSVTLIAKGRADTSAPQITFNPNGQSSYVSNGLDVEVTVEDEKPLSISNVSYGWSTSATAAPSEYTSIDVDVDTGANETSFIIPGESNSSLNGTYYLWLNGTIADTAGNDSDTPTVSRTFHFDNTNPTVSISTTKNGNDINVSATAYDAHSGIDKYYFSKDGGKTYIETTNTNYTFIDLEPGNYIITVYVIDKSGNQSELAAKTEGIGSEDFCKGSGITKFGDCLIATEAKNADIDTAKGIIKAKGSTNVTKASPSVVYKEVHKSSTTTVTSTRPEIYVGTGYTFNSSTGQYSLSNWKILDTESINFSSGDYYVTSNFNINSTETSWTNAPTIYKVVGMKTTTSTSGLKTYTYTIYQYDIAPISYNMDDVGMFSDTDNQGDSFYYRGSVSNNYVKFANKIWRVVRVNGSGEIRLIYDGTSTHENGESSTDRQIGTKAFNSYFADNTYAGYMYGDVNSFGSTVQREEYLYTKTNVQPDATYYYGTSYTRSGRSYKISGTITSGKFNSSRVGKYTCWSTSSTGTCQAIQLINEYVSETTAITKLRAYGSLNSTAAAANVTDSTVKTYLDDWYVDNFTTTQRSRLSTSAVFCNSRVIYPDLTNPDNFNDLAYGLNPTSYSIGKLRSLSTYRSTYSCEDNDSFSVNTTYGNGDLTYPIGLISLDEALNAGITNGVSNMLNYLYTGNAYWTMTPASIGSGGFMTIIMVGASGATGNYQSSVNQGVKPVINLIPSVSYSGSGTIDDPYVIS